VVWGDPFFFSKGPDGVVEWKGGSKGRKVWWSVTRVLATRRVSIYPVWEEHVTGLATRLERMRVRRNDSVVARGGILKCYNIYGVVFCILSSKTRHYVLRRCRKEAPLQTTQTPARFAASQTRPGPLPDCCHRIYTPTQTIQVKHLQHGCTTHNEWPR
jgi:hypothetical protein